MPAPVYMNSINRFSGDGVTTDWNINFAGGYLRRAHVKGIVTNEDGTVVLRTLTIADPGDFIGPNQIRVSPAAAVDEIVVLFRDTPKDLPMVDFTDGSLISERNLDLIAQQAVFIAAEMVDKFGTTDGKTDVALSTADLAQATALIAQAQATAAAADAAIAAAAAIAASDPTIPGRVTDLEVAAAALAGVVSGKLTSTAAAAAIAGLTPAADKLPYFTGAGTAALATLTAYARTLLAAADSAAAQAILGASGGAAIVSRSFGNSLDPNGATVANPMTTDVCTPGQWMQRQGVPQYGEVTTQANQSCTVTANEVYCKAFVVTVPTRITLCKVALNNTPSLSTVSFRIYAADPTTGKPGVAATEKITVDLTVSGSTQILSKSLVTPVTLAPGLYWVLQTCPLATALFRRTTTGTCPVYFAGTGVTGLFKGAAQARLDSSDISAQLWDSDTIWNTQSGTREVGYFDFTKV